MKNTIKGLLATLVVCLSYAIGYYHSPPEFIKEAEYKEVEMVISVVEDPEEINRLHQAVTQESWQMVFGFAFLNGDECIITVPEPRHQENTHAFEVIGHEVAHCIYGQWHGE